MNELRALVAGLCLILSACATSSNEGSRAFFVLPTTLPDGTSAAMERMAFEHWLVDQAGGFTELGPARGAWRAPSGAIVEERHFAYLVSIPASVDHAAWIATLRNRIEEQFEQEEAYVEQW